MRKFPCFLALLATLMIASEALGQQYGLAAFYSDSFKGRKTSSGERYDPAKMTAAHKSFPLGSKVRVTRMDNQKSIVVRVNDRGPFTKGRIIDLSRAASIALGIRKTDVRVKVELIRDPEIETIPQPLVENPKAKTQPGEPAPAVLSDKSIEVIQDGARPDAYEQQTPFVKKKPVNTGTKGSIILTARGNTKNTGFLESNDHIVTARDFKPFDLYKIQVLRPEREGFGLQVAVYSEFENVLKKLADLQEDWFKNILVSVEKGKGGKSNYKIILGPFPDAATAASYKSHARKKGLKGFVVNLKTMQYEK